MKIDTTFHRDFLLVRDEDKERVLHAFNILREQVVDTDYDDVCTEVTIDLKVKLTLLYGDMALMLTLPSECEEPIFSLFNNKRLVLANFIELENVRELCQLTKINSVFLKKIKRNEK